MRRSQTDLEELTSYVPFCPYWSDQEPPSCIYYNGGARHSLFLSMLSSLDITIGFPGRAEHRYGLLLMMCVGRRRNLMKRAFHAMTRVRSAIRVSTVWRLRHTLREVVMILVCQFASLSMTDCLSSPTAEVGTYRAVSEGTVCVHFE
jgi:hypothetical protein